MTSGGSTFDLPEYDLCTITTPECPIVNGKEVAIVVSVAIPTVTQV